MENKQAANRQFLTPGTLIVDAEGQCAHVLAIEETSGAAQLRLQLPHQRQLRLRADIVQLRDDGGYFLPFSFAELDAAHDSAPHTYTEAPQVIPVLREDLQFDKRAVDTGRGVRVHRHTSERSEVVDQPLRRDELAVTRVPVNKAVDRNAVPAARQEGDTLIVPVFEEVLVVDKQLRLKEEIHITRHQTEVRAPQTVTLKTEQVTVEHFDENAQPRGTPAASGNPKQDTNSAGQ